MKRIFLVAVCLVFNFSLIAQNLPDYNLSFNRLPSRWDEALPLGDGMLGALIWQKGDKLRFSLDRADLWDERTGVDVSKFTFKWVEQQLQKTNMTQYTKSATILMTRFLILLKFRLRH